MLNENDDARLEALGYKQELKRSFSMFETFALAFSIIGLLPSIASTLVYGLTAGPAGLVWGWFSCSILVLMIGIALGELASAIPTTGGLYYWTWYYAPKGWERYLSFLIAYANTLGNIGGVCSINYGCAVMIGAAVNIGQGSGPDAWSASNGELYAIFAGITLCHGAINTLASSINARLQSVFVAANLLVILVTFIALPATTTHRNSASFVFGNIQNLSDGWPTGFVFMLSWLCPAWTIGGYDSAIHVAEEASNAATAVPWAIAGACGLAGFLGWLLTIVIAFCASQDYETILASAQPMATIFVDSFGQKAFLAMWSCIICIQFSMGSSIMLSSSRQIWASSRDNALPLSRFLKVVGGQKVPVRSVWAAVSLSLVLGLLTVINEAASSALFTLSAIGCYLAYGLPIVCRLTSDKFVPGPFYLGKLSKPISWIAVVFMAILTVVFVFPTSGPNPTATSMNYASVIYAATIILPSIYYLVSAHKWFRGPVQTAPADTIEGVSVESDKSPSVTSEKQDAKSLGIAVQVV